MAPAEKGRIRTERGKIGKENTMNGLTEQDYAEAFGVELPDEGGAADGGTQERNICLWNWKPIFYNRYRSSFKSSRNKCRSNISC